MAPRVRKRILYLLMGVLMGVMAGILSTAGTLHAAGDLGKAEIAFSEGLLAYRDKNYAKALGLFSRAAELDPGHQAASYFLGMSRFHQGQYPQAIEAFHAAIQMKSTDPEPYFYRGLSHYRLNDRPASLPDFKEAARLAGEGNLGDLARSYVRSLEAGDSLLKAGGAGRRWFVSGGLSSEFDSNVSLDPDQVTLATLPSDQNDILFAIQARGGYHWFQNDRYRLTTEAALSQTIYVELQGFNYGLAHAEVSHQFRFGDLIFKLPTAYELSLLGQSKYLSSLLASPSMSYLWRNRLFTQITPAVRYDNFFQTLTNAAQDRDAWNLKIQVAEYLLGDDQGHSLKASYTFEQNLAQGDDWDYRAHSIGVGLLLPFPGEMDLDLHAEVTFDKGFQNVDSVLGSRRDDFTQAFGLSLSREIFKHLSLNGHYDFFRNSSNQGFFTYNRHLGGITVETTF